MRGNEYGVPMRSGDSALFPMPEVAALEPPAGFAERVAALGVAVPDSAIAQVGDYLARLLAMNERMNLTAIEDPVAAWERHVLDAWTLLPLLAGLPVGARLLDVGSGGGVPGIPLAIARPDLAVTLVEATQKKAAFLEAVVASLGLSNVRVHARRAEELSRGELRRTFDVVTARAVARLAKLIPLTAPFLRPGALLLLVKGQRADEELLEATSVLRARGLVHERTVATPTGRIVVLRARD